MYIYVTMCTYWSSSEANERDLSLQLLTGESNGREHIAQLLINIHRQLQLVHVLRVFQWLRKVWALHENTISIFWSQH